MQIRTGSTGLSLFHGNNYKCARIDVHIKRGPFAMTNGEWIRRIGDFDVLIVRGACHQCGNASSFIPRTKINRGLIIVTTIFNKTEHIIFVIILSSTMVRSLHSHTTDPIARACCRHTRTEHANETKNEINFVERPCKFSLYEINMRPIEM